MKKVILLCFMFMFMLSFTLAEDTKKVNEEFDLQVVCLNDGYCSNTAYCNINVALPNSTLLVSGQNMTNQGTFHNYTITPPLVGTYNVGGICIDRVNSQEIDFTFQVSKNGEILSTADSLNYILITLFIFILFCGCLYGFLVTPFEDKKNDLGKVIMVEKAKYVKLIFVPLTYLMFVWLLNLLLGIANNYLNYQIFTGITEFLFLFFLYLSYPLFVVWLVGFFYQLFKDFNKAIDIKKWGEVKT